MSQAAIQVTGTDTLPSGTWGLGPLSINWSIKSLTEIDVQITVFGIDVDDLKGTLSPANTKIEDDLNVLGIVTGDIAIEAKYNQGPATDGLYLEGQLKGPGFDTGQLNIRIVPW
jgi:hypothetical protein